jgi:hypothetical protein
MGPTMSQINPVNSTIYKTRRCRNIEDKNTHFHRRENLRSRERTGLDWDISRLD